MNQKEKKGTSGLVLMVWRSVILQLPSSIVLAVIISLGMLVWPIAGIVSTRSNYLSSSELSGTPIAHVLIVLIATGCRIVVLVLILSSLVVGVLRLAVVGSILVTVGSVVASTVARVTRVSSLLFGCVFGALDWLAIRASHVGCLVALLALDDVKFDFFRLAHALLVLHWVVAGDRRLVDEYVLVRVVSFCFQNNIFSIQTFKINLIQF
jgi:hypothetical protein